MILGENRSAVVENIKNNVAKGDLNAKGELNDPVISSQETQRLIEQYLSDLHNPACNSRRMEARALITWNTYKVNRNTSITGMEKIADIAGSAIITSNHFNQLDSTVIRHMIRKKDKRRLYTVIEPSNLAMEGVLGLLMNYGDTIPLSSSYDYMRHDFMDLLRHAADEKSYILIYPEQEMWFNYRKPRPCKRGAFHFASKLNIPVIPCFTQIVEEGTLDTEEFYDVHYILHILDPIWPDPDKSDRQNSIDMARENERLWKECYEKVYHKKLDYEFDYWDIAGYIPEKKRPGSKFHEYALEGRG